MFIGDNLSNTILFFIPLLFLFIAALFDIKTMKIPNKLNLIFLILRILIIPLIGIGIRDLLGFVFGFLILLIPAMIVMHKMGGDIKCFAVLGLYLGFDKMFLFAITLSVLGISIFCFNKFVLKKQKNLPFAPIFLLTFLINSLFLNNILINVANLFI